MDISHFDILQFLVQLFCGSKQMTFNRNRNLPALAGSGLIERLWGLSPPEKPV
jgi:hypothetical protein